MNEKLYRKEKVATVMRWEGFPPLPSYQVVYHRAEYVERYAALGMLVAKHFQDAETYLRWAGGERGMKANGGFRERPDRQALAYIKLRDAVRAIKEADGEG